MIYLRGDSPRLSVRWTDENDSPFDPAEVTIRIGSTALSAPVAAAYNGGAGDVVRDDTGEYHYDYTLPAAGTYYVLWQADGVLPGVVEYQVDVRDDLTPWLTGAAREPLVTLTEFREYLKSDPGDPLANVSSFELLDLLNAASSAFEADTHRSYQAQDDIRYYASDDDLILAVDDLTAVDEIALDLDADGTYETVLDVADYQLERADGRAASWPYERVRLLPGAAVAAWPAAVRAIRVTGTFGFSAAGRSNELVKMAVKLKAGRYWARKDSPLGVQIVYDGSNARSNALSLRADGDYNDIVAMFSREPVVLVEPVTVSLRPASFRLGGSRWRSVGRLI